MGINRKFLFYFFSISTVLLVLCNPVLFQHVYAQAYQFHNFSVDDGLPSNEVYHCIQDKKGYIWLATDRGVSRYNGYEFENFTTADGLHNNVIFQIYADDQNRIWFSGLGNQLSWYNQLSDSFAQVLIPQGVLKGNNFHLYITQVKQDTLCFVTGSYMYTTVCDTSFRLVHKKNISNVDLKRNAFTSLSDILQNTLGRYKNPLCITLFDNKGMLKVNFSDTFFYAARDVKAEKNRLFVVDVYGSEKKIMNLFPDAFILDSSGSISLLPLKHILCVWTDKKRLWIGTQNGLFTFNSNDTLFTSPLEIHFFKNKSVTAVLGDAAGGYWFSTRQSGVYYLQNQDVRHITQKNGLYSSAVKYIRTIKTRQCDTCMVLGYFDASVITSICKSEIDHVFQKHSNKEIVNLTYVNDSTLLGVLQGGNVFLFKEDVCIDFPEVKVLPVFYDQTTQTIWGKGYLPRFKLNADRFFEILEPAASYSGPGQIMHRYRDTLWTGGHNGLGFLDNNTLLKIDSSWGRITDFASHQGHYMAVATLGNGVFIKRKDKLLHLTENQGLVNNVCNNIYIDQKGEIWVGTNSGLSHIRFTHSTFNSYKIKNYSRYNGLISNQINAIHRKGNILWVGTSKGISLFPLGNIEKEHHTPSVYIEKVAVDEQPVADYQNMSLAYKDNVEVSFIGLDFKPEKGFVYQYRLAGLDTNWQTTTNRTVRFLKLSDGQYTFQVRTIPVNLSSESFSSIVSFPFFVKAPFWKTLWFWILCICSIAIPLFYWIYQVKEKSILYGQLADMKQQLLAAQMNPHFLFNSFNSIRHFILKDEKDKADDYIVKISRLVRGVLNNSFKKEITLQEELNAVEHYLEIEKMRMVGGFCYEIKIENDVAARNIFVPPTILQPFVENAVWHGIKPLTNRNGMISIICYREKNDLVCQIEDNGVGIKEENIPKKNNKNQSLGIHITRKRLAVMQSLYRKKVSLSILPFEKNGQVQGTRVWIKFYRVYE